MTAADARPPSAPSSASSASAADLNELDQLLGDAPSAPSTAASSRKPSSLSPGDVADSANPPAVPPRDLRPLAPYDTMLMRFVVDAYDGDIVDHVYQGTGAARFVDGNVYEGQWENGKMHGVGKFTYVDGTIYHGEFVHNIPSGQGTIYWSDGSIYVGSVKDGLRHGYGKLQCADGVTAYSGDWVEGKRCGKGTMTYNTEGTSGYVGDWKDNLKRGKGVMKYPSGNVYDGEWFEDTKHGYGTMNWIAEKQTYSGSWENGVPHGRGEYVWLQDDANLAQFNRYTGDWEEGQRSGHGIYYYASGAVYDGSWKNNLKHGNGKFTFEDGTVFEGEFINDRMKGFDKYQAGVDQQVPIDIHDLCAGSNDPNAMIGSVRNVVLRYISDFKKWYHHYCALARSENSLVFSMTRFEFWQFLQDCHIPTESLPLVVIDRTIAMASKERFGPLSEFFQHPHNPDQSLLFRELVAWIIRVANLHYPNLANLADRLTQLITHYIQPAMIDSLELNQSESTGSDRANLFQRDIRAYVRERKSEFLDLYHSFAKGHPKALDGADNDVTISRRDLLFLLKERNVFDDQFTPKTAMDVMIPDRKASNTTYAAAELTYLEFLQALLGFALKKCPSDSNKPIKSFQSFVDTYVFPLPTPPASPTPPQDDDDQGQDQELADDVEDPSGGDGQSAAQAADPQSRNPTTTDGTDEDPFPAPTTLDKELHGGDDDEEEEV